MICKKSNYIVFYATATTARNVLATCSFRNSKNLSMVR